MNPRINNSERVNRYAEFLRASGINVVNVDDVDWYSYQGFIAPAYLHHCIPDIESTMAARAVSKCGGLFARWTSDFDRPSISDWWYVIRDGSYSLNDCGSKMRNQVNRGLKRFTVRHLSCKELLSTGYEVCRKAVKRYNNDNFLPSRQAFERRVTAASNYPDVVEYIGVFSEKQLVGFSENYIQDGGVYWESIWLDPEFIGDYSSYALTHYMLDYYLTNRRMRYVSDGSRSIYHETNVQEFFITKFGFRRAFARMHIKYSIPVRVAIDCLYPFHRTLNNVLAKADWEQSRKVVGLLNQEKISRSMTAKDGTKELADMYRQVAHLHVANLDRGFLSTLGVGFLSELYRAIGQCQGTILIVKSEQGKVVGFAAGLSAPMSVIYRRMMRRMPTLVWSLIPVLFSFARLNRLIEIFRYTNSESERGDLPVAELLSIAVSPACRGKGIAETMYSELMDQFRQTKITQFKIVVGSELAPAHKFYHRMGAQAIREITIHGGARSVVYVQKVTQ
jgi:ribosomal protein S18 acetylase RimI-like enzyme